jgi:transcriptional regulator with XRE-family HTH domain
MTTEEFNYYNNTSIRMSKHQNFSLKNKWRLKDLADRLGIPIPALSKIKTGCTDISLSHPEQLAGIYKITIVELLSIKNGQTEAALNSNLSIRQGKPAYRDREIINLQNKII